MDEEFLYSRREKYRVTGRTEEGLVLLEDTGCFHAGPPCRIAVEPEGDGYRFVKCLNGTAESYKMYHMDYTYYTGQADAKRDGIRWQIDRYRKLQSVLKEQLESTVRLCGVCKTDKRRDCRFDPFTTESVYVMPVDYKDVNGVIRVRVNEITVTPGHEVIQFTVNPHMAGGAYFENLRFGPEKELFHAARYNGCDVWAAKRFICLSTEDDCDMFGAAREYTHHMEKLKKLEYDVAEYDRAISKLEEKLNTMEYDMAVSKAEEKLKDI